MKLGVYAVLLLGLLAAGCGPAGLTPIPMPTVLIPEALVSPPTATPKPHPIGPPEAARATFGPIEEAWTVVREHVSLYDTREPQFGKPAGTSTGYYVRLGGVVHGVTWDSLPAFKALKPGDTVNLHPAPNVVCINDPTHPAGTRCWRLMYVYPGRRAQAPLIGI